MRISDWSSDVYSSDLGVDRFPFEPNADALRVMTSNLVMPVQYRGNAALAPVKDELGEITHYSANRTYILDRIQSLVGSKAVVLTGYGDQKETLITHLTDNVRDETPDKPAVWTKTDRKSTRLNSSH